MYDNEPIRVTAVVNQWRSQMDHCTPWRNGHDDKSTILHMYINISLFPITICKVSSFIRFHSPLLDARSFAEKCIYSKCELHINPYNMQNMRFHWCLYPTRYIGTYNHNRKYCINSSILNYLNAHIFILYLFYLYFKWKLVLYIMRPNIPIKFLYVCKSNHKSSSIL